MIKGITVENYIGNIMYFSLTKPEDSGFVVTQIDGLGPVKAPVNQSRYANLDGSRFNSVYAEPRTIIIYFNLLPNPTVEQTRLNSYKFFPLKREVKITVHTDKRTVITYGRVESNEPDIFTNMENTAITIQCEKSYFFDMIQQEKILFGSDPKFEFPFSNESVSNPLLLMSDLISNEKQNIFYEGDTETGVIIIVNCHGRVDNLKLYNFETYDEITINSEYLSILTGSALKDRDIVEICTIEGERSASLYRDGIKINIINTLNRNPDWFNLRRGDNHFGYTATFGIENVTMDIRYDVLYEGV